MFTVVGSQLWCARTTVAGRHDSVTMSLSYTPGLGVPAVRLLFLGLRTEFGTAAEAAARFTTAPTYSSELGILAYGLLSSQAVLLDPLSKCTPLLPMTCLYWFWSLKP